MNQAFRSMQLMVLLLLVLIGTWLAFPPIASTVLGWWLRQQGYEQVEVSLGRPGLRSMTVPRVALARRLTGEMVTVLLTNAQAEYTLLGLLSGRIDLLTLRQLSIEIMSVSPQSHARDHASEAVQDAPESLLNALTASDIVQRLPFFPWDEVRLEEVRLYREQATGPLRTVVMTGTVKHERQSLAAEMLLQGSDTIPYELRVSGQSPADMSLQLRAAQPNAPPVVLWRSQAVPKEAKVHIEGVLEINVRELAPFLALVVPIGSEWQRVDGNVTLHWAGTAASGIPVSSLLEDPATELHATVQVSAVLPELRGYGKDLAVKTTGTLSGNARLIHWTIPAGASAAATVGGTAMKALEPLRMLAPFGPQPVRIDATQESTGELFWSEAPPRYTASGPLRISYGSPTGPAYAECVVTQIIGRGLTFDHADGRVVVKGVLPSAWHPWVKVRQVTGELHGEVTWTGTRLRGMLSPSTRAAFTDLNQGPVRISGGVFHLEGPLRLEFDASSQRWSTGQANWVWRSPRLEVGRSHMAMQRAALRIDRLEGSERTYRADMTASMEGLTLAHSRARSAPFDVSIGIEADVEGMKADLRSRSRDGAITVGTKLEHAWSTGRGTAHGVLEPVVFDRARFRLRQLWIPWPYPVDLIEGSVTGTFEWRWSTNGQQLQVQGGAADIAVERLGGHYQDIALTGMNTKLKLAIEGLERVTLSRPSDVTIATIQTGVDVTDVAMTVEGEWDVHEPLPLLELRNIRCAVLGGTATSQGVRADLGYPPYGLTVLVRALDLHKVLSLEQQKGLDGIGILDGSIPLTVTSQGLTIKDATLEARPPGGIIRYTASPDTARAVSQANANMQVVLQALSNFHFNVLQVGAQYAENGTLHVQARLEGKNPDQKSSPPIHMNLTLQENVPALLKSLRLVNQLEDSVRSTFATP